MDNLFWPPFHDTITDIFNETNRYAWIATADIGRVAAQAFDRPGEVAGRTIALAGDSLTKKETLAIWKEVTGKDLGGGKPDIPEGLAATMVVSYPPCS